MATETKAFNKSKKRMEAIVNDIKKVWKMFKKGKNTESIQIVPIDDNLETVIMKFIPSTGIWKNLELGIKVITFANDVCYPFTAPKISFINRVEHPNISPTGIICLTTLSEKSAWSAGISLVTIVDILISLLSDANVDSPMNRVAAEKWKELSTNFTNELEFEEQYRKYATEYYTVIPENYRDLFDRNLSDIKEHYSL
jgi:ubiquitin-protein ligase